MRAIEYETRVTSVIVAPAGDPTFSEMATTVTITDEAAGEYVEVSQEGRENLGKIAIDSIEWPAIRAAIDRMIAECRDNGKENNAPMQIVVGDMAYDD